MKKNICYIIGNGEYYGLDFTKSEGDYVIAADGGLSYLNKNNIIPDLVIGDFDSFKGTPIHPNIITLNTNKDVTDSFAATLEGLRLGYKTFLFYCCTGGRADHTFANLQLLAYLAKNDAQGFLVDKNNTTTAIANSSISFNEAANGYISIFSYSDISEGVAIKGLKYSLDDATLTNTHALGVSNEFIGSSSTISVKDGVLLIIFPNTISYN